MNNYYIIFFETKLSPSEYIVSNNIQLLDKEINCFKKYVPIFYIDWVIYHRRYAFYYN